MRTESQNHGFLFEEQIKKRINEFLELVEDINYTNKWDIPPVSVKSFKFDPNKDNNRIYFGSIENIFKIMDGFFLALIGYEQVGVVKKVVFSDFIFINSLDLFDLKGSLSLEELKDLSEKLKSFKEGYHAEAREWYKSIKHLYDQKTKFQINFKVDSKTQRRIQCSLTLEELYEHLGYTVSTENRLSIQDVLSTARERNPKSK